MSFMNDLLGRKPIEINKTIEGLTEVVKELTYVTDLIERLKQRKRIFEAITQPGVEVSIDILNLKVTNKELNDSKLYGITGNDIIPSLVKLIKITNEENDEVIETLSKKILKFENNPTANNINDLIIFVKKEREKINAK